MHSYRSLPFPRLLPVARKTLLVLLTCVIIVWLPHRVFGHCADPQSTATKPTSPLEHFSQLVSDSWTVTAQTGRKMQHTWKWGPGKNSIERWTDGESAQGDPWRELIVYYWQPDEKRVRFLGISPYASGINQGTIEFDGQKAIANSRLAQTRGTRDFQTHWQFKNADCYQETLLEKDSTGKLTELVSFEHIREPVHANLNAKVAATPAAMRDELSGLRVLLGDAWEGQMDSRPHVSLRTSIDWIPHANFLLGRVSKKSDGDASAEFVSFFVYFDVESKSARCLCLTSAGNVYAGEIPEAKDGRVQVVLQSNSSDENKIVKTAIEATDPNHLLQQVQTSRGKKESLSTTIRHAR